MFMPCCNSPMPIQYSIYHKPQRIDLPKELLEAIERLYKI